MATAQVIAFDQSIKFFENIGIENMFKHEKELIEYGQEILKKNNSVKLIGNPKKKVVYYLLLLKEFIHMILQLF